MGVNFIEEKAGAKDFTGVKGGEVVILPAFGASVQEMKLLNERNVQIVDTTCPWVSKVWNAVDTHARKAHTSIIHGKWAHEETIATASFATTYGDAGADELDRAEELAEAAQADCRSLASVLASLVFTAMGEGGEEAQRGGHGSGDELLPLLME